MKRGGFLKRCTPLQVRDHSETNDSKDNVQQLARQIVIIRDGGCILRNLLYRNFPQCGPVLQADHLVTRANSATYLEDLEEVLAEDRTILTQYLHELDGLDSDLAEGPDNGDGGNGV
jgi:hypothetical protein